MASQLGEVSPFLRWSLAVIAGGGAAGLMQAGSVLARGATTMLTGGFGNLAIALLEFVGAVAMTLLSLFVPFLAAVGLFVLLLLLISCVRSRGSKNSLTTPTTPPN